MPEPISPWTWEAGLVRLVSPDGRHVAEIVDLKEIAMGAPTRGLLQLSNGMTLADCNPSMVWSEDSRLLAVPVWNLDRRRGDWWQRIAIVWPDKGLVRRAPGTFKVLELASFSGGIVRGVDCPAAAEPKPVAVDISRIGWDSPDH